MPSAGPRILIVIPALNEAGHIDRVISTLLDGTGDETALVVADGGSVDGTREIVAGMAAADPRIRQIANEKRIQSAGVNLAVESCRGDAEVLIRADAHSFYPRGFCRELVAEMERTGAVAVTVPMKTMAENGFAAGAAAAQNSVLGTGGSAHRTGKGARFVDHGHHALIRLDAFLAVGGYDPEFTHNEDAELDWRLRKANGRIWLTDKVSIGYVPRGEAGSLFRQYWNYGRGRAAMLMKHRARPRLRQVLPLAVPAALAVAAIGAVAAIVGGEPRWLWLGAPAAIWAAICLGYGLLLAIRARSGAVASAGPAAMVMHLGWSLGFMAQALRVGR